MEQDTNVAAVAAEAQDGAKKKKKKKDKMRSAWISFTGRIVAQIVGAMATVGLGVTVLHQYKGNDVRPPHAQTVAIHQIDNAAVAVLPVANFSADAAADYLADGLTEFLISDLAKVNGLRVISRTSSMYFKGQRDRLGDIAAQLGARWIVEASIVREGERLRVTAQLIDGTTDVHTWAERYDCLAGDLPNIEAEVANAIAQAVAAVASPKGAVTATANRDRS
jgi:TolB-like protein